MLGRVPVYTDGAIGIVDVRDVAEGHLLADKHGEVGERYILGGRNFTFERLFADLGRLCGMAPPLRLPPRAAEATAARAGRGRARVAAHAARGARGGQTWWTYRSTKARRELGWRARPHEETLEATVAWHLEREHERLVRTRRSQPLQYRVAGAGARRRRGSAGPAAPATSVEPTGPPGLRVPVK